ncbi:MAG: hypothetical protein NT069_22120 [Planctomycetota bacterium]|nr:hypothetical protein [Planctomycetota bacterium]
MDAANVLPQVFRDVPLGGIFLYQDHRYQRVAQDLAIREGAIDGEEPKWFPCCEGVEEVEVVATPATPATNQEPAAQPQAAE